MLGLVFGFAMWKTTVVRDHTASVFAAALVGMFSFAPRMERGTWLMALLAIGVAVVGASAIAPRAYLDVVGSARAFAGQARDAFVPGRADEAIARTQAALRGHYRIEPAILDAIGAHTVHVDPYYTSVIEAYPDLRWVPLPIFQSYSAYTPALDRQNADLLRSAGAPERILRSFRPAPPTDQLRQWIGRPVRPGETLPATVDCRFRWFESPEATLETFCRYREMLATAGWQVLGRTDRACGAPEALGTVVARAGTPVTVPVETRPDRFVIARIHGLEPSLAGRIRAALYKGRDWYVELDDTRYRLVAATAADGLLLAVPQAADGSGNFAFGAPIRTLKVTQGRTATNRAPR
jgi:hypothetical protein